MSQSDRIGLYWEPGVGKTAGSTHIALYHSLVHDVEQWFVIVPPILIPQWAIWLAKVIDLASGKPLTTTEYAGTPVQRSKLKLDTNFVIMSYTILKKDFAYLHDHCQRRNVGFIADEATAIKNIETDNHKALALISEGRPLQLLTGTPINKPGDAYAYIKLVAPGTYRNKRQFDRLHEGEKDEWGNVIEWANLDLLAQNMKINSSRIIRREVRSELPPVIYTHLNYKLDPEHIKLYRQVAEERLVEFKDGSEIDAISASALRAALQQIIVNWGEFDEDPNVKPKILDVIEEVMEEIGEKKLTIVANFRRSNRYLQATLAKKYGAVAIYGDISTTQKQKALRDFVSKSSCRIIILHPESAGFGVDGLQHVCSDMLVVEAPTTPTPFQQVVARLDRDGQNDVVHVRVAIASGTVQVGMFRSLLDKDELAMRVQGGLKSLRDSVYGE